MTNLILASGSLRRQELLGKLGVPFKVVISQVDERKIEERLTDPRKLALALARAKSQAVQMMQKENKLQSPSIKTSPILAADTVVAVKDINRSHILGKPLDRQQATDMLSLLKGKTHRVITGLALIDNYGRIVTGLAISRVQFFDFSPQDLEDCPKDDVYKDRAGAYGIQDPGCRLVQGYHGSYTNILGFPLEKVVPMLKKAGIKLTTTSELFYAEKDWKPKK